MASLSAAEVADRLRAELERLVEDLLPNGTRAGVEYRAHGPDGAIWSVVLRGSKRGVFASWGDDRAKGDPLELVRWAACAGDRPAAYAWALRWLGEDRHGPPPPPEDRARRAAEAAAGRARGVAEGQAADERRRRLAHARWLRGQRLRGTPAAAYLEARGVGPSRFPDAPLQALRFAPAVSHPDGQQLPAMLAAIVDPRTGRYLATHHTFLAFRDGAWRKALVTPAKLVLGRYAGGLIPLLRGGSGVPLKQAPQGDELLMAEGIENALTVGLAFPELRAVAAVAVQNAQHIALPPAIGSVLLVHDRDGENDAVQQARDRAYERWRVEQRSRAPWIPPEGYEDANAWWQAILRDASEDDARQAARRTG